MRASKGKTEVVAPSSAPMLAMVALPVALMDAVPGPKYSRMAFVPPELSQEGTELVVDVRGKELPVRIVPRPFYKRPFDKAQDRPRQA